VKTSKTAEQVREGRFQAFGHLFDVDQRDIPDSALNATVVRSVESATLGRFLLIDLLRLAYAANRTAKPNPNVDRHHLKSSRR